MKQKIILIVSLLITISIALFLKFYNSSNVKIEKKKYPVDTIFLSPGDLIRELDYTEYDVIITTWTEETNIRNYWHKSWKTRYPGHDFSMNHYETKYEKMVGICPDCKKEIWVESHYGDMFSQIGFDNVTNYHGVYFHDKCSKKCIEDLMERLNETKNITGN